MNFVYFVYVYKYNLKYKTLMLLLQLKKKESFNSQVNVFLKKKKKNLHGYFIGTFLNACDILFSSFALKRVNVVLQEWYQSLS